MIGQEKKKSGRHQGQTLKKEIAGGQEKWLKSGSTSGTFNFHKNLFRFIQGRKWAN